MFTALNLPLKLTRPVVVMVLALACFAIFASFAGAEVAPDTFLAKLNAQRAANGFPSNLTLNPTWSQDCQLHNNYQYLNGEVTHFEQPGNPGYSSAGASAGENSVVAMQNAWDTSNPFENGPFHMADLLDPRLERIGFDNSQGYMCAWVTSVNFAHQGNRLYTYPGDGTTGLYYAERTNESPAAPSTEAGLFDTNYTTAGPYILVMGDGGWLLTSGYVKVDRASLRGPDGAVNIAIIDSSRAPAHAADFATNAFLLPLKPLKPNTTYHASVTMSKSGVTLSKDWSFTTGDTTLGLDSSTGGGSTGGGPSGSAFLTSALPSKKIFRIVEAPKVKIMYGFSESALYFQYTLARKTLKGWLVVHRGGQTATTAHPLQGVQSKTVKTLFGTVKVLAGVYRVQLGCDSHPISKTVTFTIKK